MTYSSLVASKGSTIPVSKTWYDRIALTGRTFCSDGNIMCVLFSGYYGYWSLEMWLVIGTELLILFIKKPHGANRGHIKQYNSQGLEYSVVKR